jgi:hypothetical protein
MANFWTDGKIEPKRQNRWVVQFDGIYNGNMFFATKVGRPSIEVSNKEHKFLNHTFNYPGRATWKPITLTMVDTAGGGEPDKGIDTMASLMDILSDSGYIVPANENSLNTIAKGKATNSLSSGARGGAGTGQVRRNSNGVIIQLVDPEGRTIEQWTLKNAFITKFTPSELSYEDDGIATVDIEITYDFCVFNEGSARTKKFEPQNTSGQG